jgi:hypothetical protein
MDALSTPKRFPFVLDPRSFPATLAGFTCFEALFPSRVRSHPVQVAPSRTADPLLVSSPL